MMWEVQIPKVSAEKSNYGLGFSTGATPGGVKWIGHSGAQEKTRTMMMLDPHGQRGVVVMTNSEYANVNKIASAILDMLK